MGSSSVSAVFIDYENIYYYLKNFYKDPPELSTYTSEIIRSLRKHIEGEMGMQVIVTNAYADFERLGSGSLGTLYLMGIMTQNVLGTAHKNAADMQMCIDLMQILYTRSDMQNFVLVAGDRDYIPVVQHLKRQGRSVYVAAFRDTLSGDLLEIIGESFFIDIAPLIHQTSLAKLESHRAEAQKKEVVLPPGIGPKILGRIELDDMVAKNKSGMVKAAIHAEPTLVKHAPVRTSGLSDNAKACVECILNFIDEKGFREPGVTPFLRFLTDEMPLLANWERKDLLEQLQHSGVISIASRPGYEFPFSVIVVNYDHPMVKSLVK